MVRIIDITQAQLIPTTARKRVRRSEVRLQRRVDSHLGKAGGQPQDESQSEWIHRFTLVCREKGDGARADVNTFLRAPSGCVRLTRQPLQTITTNEHSARSSRNSKAS